MLKCHTTYKFHQPFNAVGRKLNRPNKPCGRCPTHITHQLHKSTHPKLTLAQCTTFCYSHTDAAVTHHMTHKSSANRAWLMMLMPRGIRMKKLVKFYYVGV